MKKLIAGLVLVMAFCVSAMVWRVDDFEGGSFGDINTYDQDGDTYNWEISPTTKNKAGSYVARSASAGLTPDNLMDFPVVYTELDAFFSFWVAAESGTNIAENYQVYLDFNGPCMPDASMLIWEETLSSTDWKEVKLDLKPFILAHDEFAYDANVFIGIRHFGSADQSALLVDDIKFYTPPVYVYDEGYFSIPESVVAPFSPIEMSFFIYDATGYDMDGNFIGYQSVELHYVITDADGVHPEAFIPLSYIQNPFDEYTYLYIAAMDGYPMGTKMDYWVETTDNSGYEIVGKSEVFNIEWGEVNFSEGFEGYDSSSGWLPEGWVTHQVGEIVSSWDKPWEVDTASQNVHTGNYSATSAAQNNFGVWLTENYLVSPVIRINAYDTYLKYYMNAQTAAGEQNRERWAVLVSTVDGDGTDIENFVEIARDSIIPTPENLDTWYEKTHFLGDYKDQYVRIMWKHFYTSTATKLDRFLNLDDISIAEMPKLTMHDSGNAATPGDPFEITITATDYSGFDNCTIFYTVKGQEEMSVVMTDNGNDTFTGYIPGQPLDTVASWYVVITDGSQFHNTTTSAVYDVIWFADGVLEWGTAGTSYLDYPEPFNAGDKIGMDWNFGTKASLYVNKIEVGLTSDAPDLSWKVVEFNETPTENVLPGLEGTHTFTAGGSSLDLDARYNTPIYGHVALYFEFNNPNEVMLDESGNKAHAWQWNSVTQWTTNNWGAFYVKMYVSQTPNGIEEEFVSSTTELSQNYPNPFNPNTNISFYNRVSGDVSLTVYNTKGEQVATLINERMNEGYRKVNFDAANLNSGVYYYTLKTPEKNLTRKMLLVK